MQPLRHYISPELQERAKDNHLLSTLLRQHLPDPLREHVWVAGVDDHCLHLITDSPMWATQLRYQQRELLKHIQYNPALKLSKISITVSPMAAPPHPQRKAQRLTLTPATRAAIRAAAATISDEETRAIFERIASR